MSLHVPFRFVVVGRVSVFNLVRACLLAIFALGLPQPASADEVLDWNGVTLRAILTPPALLGPLQYRAAAIVHASMFDALVGSTHLLDASAAETLAIIDEAPGLDASAIHAQRLERLELSAEALPLATVEALLQRFEAMALVRVDCP